MPLLISRDECNCPCHSTGAVHVMPCCTGFSRNEFVIPNPDVFRAAYFKNARSPDQAIIDQYSTPGLKKNKLSREAKKIILQEGWKHDTKEEREALLDKLYPPPPEERGLYVGIAREMKHGDVFEATLPLVLRQ